VVCWCHEDSGLSGGTEVSVGDNRPMGDRGLQGVLEVSPS
jgi:hypothetical protein